MLKCLSVLSANFIYVFSGCRIIWPVSTLKLMPIISNICGKNTPNLIAADLSLFLRSMRPGLHTTLVLYLFCKFLDQQLRTSKNHVTSQFLFCYLSCKALKNPVNFWTQFIYENNPIHSYNEFNIVVLV